MKKIIITLISFILIIITFIFYNNYLKTNPKLINKLSEINITKTDIDLKKYIFSKEKYYISQNYERYIKYQTNHIDLKPDEIIRQVNSNLDYEFYTNVSKADLSKNNLILVNKYYYLEKDYEPELVKMDSNYSKDGWYMQEEAYNHFKEMVDAAKKEDIIIYNISSYRSYYSQDKIYNRYVNNDGKTNADTYSARPGYSEHQTGLASDINTTSDNFEFTKQYEWLKDNSYKFGFILRYPKDKEYITGYQFEPWHYRYVGIEVAKFIFENDITFEEYYAKYVK